MKQELILQGDSIVKGSANDPRSQGGYGYYSGKKAELFEVLVFLFLLVPSMVFSLFAVKKAP